MTGLDWIIVAFAAALAVLGYQQGFIAGALSLVGFAAGAFVGTRLGPALLHDGSSSPYAPAFGLMGAVLGGAVLASGLEGIGMRLRRALRIPGLGAADGLLGAGLSACVALGIVWVAAALALQAPNVRGLRHDVQRSVILRKLNEIMPPSGLILNALARLDPLPSIGGPAPQIAPPRAAIARSAGVQAAAASVVRILGTACGARLEGSGWVAAPGVVVTNAHVVAGEDDTVVESRGQPPDLPAKATVFDRRNDIAILRVPQLAAPALRLAEGPRPGTAVGILGYPRNGPFRIRAGRLAPVRTAITQDAYGQGPVTRKLAPFRGKVEPGNSGGPLVDAQSTVSGTVFAAATSGPQGGYAVPNSIVRRDLNRAHGTVDTGPCAP
jgi:S1-C subfamily serine protease